MMSGVDMSRVTMQVIKFCLRSRNHMIKKLVIAYWEVLDKKTPDGKLKEEMILVWCVCLFVYGLSDMSDLSTLSTLCLSSCLFPTHNSMHLRWERI